MKRAFADILEGQVHYVTEGTGEPVLLLHETPRSWMAYSDVIPLLAKSYRVIAMDTLGFGDSDPPLGVFEIGDFAESVAHFLDSLGITKIDIMGERTGACIALEVAVRWPERVRRLILTGLPFWNSTEERLARLERERMGTLGAQAVDGSHCSEIWQLLLTTRVPGGGKDGVSEKDLEYIASSTLDWLKAGPRTRETHMAVFRYDPEARLPLVQAPTLVLGVTGEGPPAYTKRAQEVKALISRGSVAIIEGGDMRLMHARADEVAETVLRFLEIPTP